MVLVPHAPPQQEQAYFIIQHFEQVCPCGIIIGPHPAHIAISPLHVDCDWRKEDAWHFYIDHSPRKKLFVYVFTVKEISQYRGNVMVDSIRGEIKSPVSLHHELQQIVYGLFDDLAYMHAVFLANCF